MSNFKIAFVVLGGMAVTGFLGAAAISPAEAASVKVVEHGKMKTPKSGAPAPRKRVVIKRDHREPRPTVSKSAPAPRQQKVRDHREPREPRVRDHRN